MDKIKNILIIALLCLVQQAMAQKTVTGTVTEMLGGKAEPCIGVNVTFQNAQKRTLGGTVTDFNGNYSLKVPADEKGQLYIVFSYIGMKAQSFKYTGQTTLNVKMGADEHQIKEVKVSGKRNSRNEMGISERQASFATQKIAMSDLTAVQPVTSIEEALQGQVGGLDIIAAGDPGAKSSIRIRGTATISGSGDPLIVINDVPYSTDIDDSFDFNTANQEDFAQMLSLNPNDIESIEVLKDAASTAVYGTAGANGVLRITTKKGAMGKTMFTFSTKNTWKFEPKSIPMLSGNDYVAYVQDALWNSANAEGLDGNSKLEQLFNYPEIGYNPDWRYFDEYNQNVDWLSYITKNAFTTDNSFSMSGGGEKATYRYSLSYLSEGGTTVGTGLQRLNTGLDVGYRFSEKITVNAEYTYSDTKKEAPYTDKLRAEAMRKMPNKSPYYINDATGEMTDTYFTRQGTDEFQGAFNESKNFHPLIMAEDSYNNMRTREQKMTVRAYYYPTSHLRFNAYVSMKYKTVKSEGFLPQSAIGVSPTDVTYMDEDEKIQRNYYANRAEETFTNNFSLQSEVKGMYTNAWNDNMHQFTATALFRQQQSRSSGSSSTRYNVASASLADPSAGNGILLAQSSTTAETRKLAAIGSLVYTFMDRYTIQGTMNYEGNSSINRNDRWGMFYAIGASWQFADEPFMKWSKDVLTEWKWRVSYGKSGNTPSGTSPYVGTYNSIGSYIDGNAVTAITMQLNKLKWESTTEVDLGFDFNFFDGKLTGAFDYYNKKTEDLLQKKSFVLPSSTGYSNTTLGYYNSGSLRNRGWEFRIDYEALKTKDWKLKLNFNINHNENEIIDLPGYQEENYEAKNGTYATRIEPGTSIGSFFGYKYLGVYQNTEDTYAKDADGNIMYDLQGKPIIMSNLTKRCYPGDAKYADINNDGVIDKNDIVYLGNYNPTLEGGGGFNLSYKNFTLTVFLHYRLGQKILNQARMDAENMSGADNQSTAVLRRWRNEGDQTDIPRALWGSVGYNYLGSDRFIEDCSYLRLKTLSLSYRLPKSFCKSIGLTSANVFVTGYDLLTFTKYKGQDPEIVLPTTVTELAKDESQTPRSRRFSMGVTINF